MSAANSYSVCSICDIGCQLRSEARDGKVQRVIAHDNPMLAKNICYKGVAAPSIHNHLQARVLTVQEQLLKLIQVKCLQSHMRHRDSFTVARQVKQRVRIAEHLSQSPLV